MPRRQSTDPITFFFLVLPYGISNGFASITLPFILPRAGFSVAMAASIVAIGVSANLWRFLWGPVADLTLTARRWYLLGLSTAAGTLLLLGFTPLRPGQIALLIALVFVSQVAGTLIVLSVGGLLAHTVAEEAKGRAAGWIRLVISAEMALAAVQASGLPVISLTKQQVVGWRLRCSCRQPLSILPAIY